MAIEKRNRAAQADAASTPSTTPSSKSRVSAPTVKTLYDSYSLLCKQDSILHPLSSSEFREVVGSLETLSLVTPVDGKTGSFSALLNTPGRRGRKKDVFQFGGNGDEKRVASCVGEREMEVAVEGMGAGILRSILSGEALD
jgi:cell division control protein 6